MKTSDRIIVGVIAFAVFILAFACGVLIGLSDGKNKVEREALSRGFAYQAEPTGEFTWNDELKVYYLLRYKYYKNGEGDEKK